ncbi:MAG: sterol desaturase family protein [Acidobacteria bacterium]|nr:sterol desaturase family protein [Acidobacteriota bacterium]
MNYWKEFFPFYFYSIIAASLAIKASLYKNYSLFQIALLAIVGIVSWMFLEYGLHRFFFHYKAKTPTTKQLVYRMHLAHHENPKALDSLFSSLYTSAPIALLYCLLTWAITGSWQIMSYLFLGLIIGYFCYELLHYQAHHHTPKIAILKYLKKYHMLHHHQSSNLRFGVTSPFIDWLFGTYKAVSSKLLNYN